MFQIGDRVKPNPVPCLNRSEDSFGTVIGVSDVYALVRWDDDPKSERLCQKRLSAAEGGAYR